MVEPSDDWLGPGESIRHQVVHGVVEEGCGGSEVSVQHGYEP